MDIGIAVGPVAMVTHQGPHGPLGSVIVGTGIAIVDQQHETSRQGSRQGPDPGAKAHIDLRGIAGLPGQTLGMQAWRIKLVGFDGEAPVFARSRSRTDARDSFADAACDWRAGEVCGGGDPT